MTEKIRIGIIGCSTIAKNSTIPAILKSNNTKLEHIGSRSNNKAQEFSKMFDCKKFGRTKIRTAIKAIAGTI